MDSPLTLRYMGTALKGHLKVQLMSNCCEECTHNMLTADTNIAKNAVSVTAMFPVTKEPNE
jgi:hypothetical protein